MKAIVFPIDGPAREVDQDWSSLERLQEEVGGFIEGVPMRALGDNVTAFINEEGKLRGLPVNRNATIAFEGGLLPGDVIVGPMVVLAYDAQGETVEAPLAVRNQLLARYGEEA